jgi:hypothetical protein
MTGIAKCGFLVLGSGIVNQHVAGLEVDGLSLIENCPYAFTVEYLLGFIITFIDVLN